MRKFVGVAAAILVAAFEAGCGSSEPGLLTGPYPGVSVMPRLNVGYALPAGPYVSRRAVLPVSRPAMVPVDPYVPRRVLFPAGPNVSRRALFPVDPFVLGRATPRLADTAVFPESGLVRFIRGGGVASLVGLQPLVRVPPFWRGRARMSRQRSHVPVASTRPRRSRSAPVRHDIATLKPGSQVALRRRPGGPPMGILSSVTPFGSRQTLGVLARRRHWLKVDAAGLPDGRFAWVRAAQVRLTRTPWAVVISRVRRRLTVLEGRRAVRSFPVGIGSATSPTPLGRFSVTDELPGPRYSPVYGCCILALSGTQGHLPAGYGGGNRLAIHGTNLPQAIGGTDSLGCIYTADGDLRYLTRRLPLGTPVTIVR